MEYKVDLMDTPTTGRVTLYNDKRQFQVPAISWTWINSFVIKCKFKVGNQEFEVKGYAEGAYYDI